MLDIAALIALTLLMINSKIALEEHNNRNSTRAFFEPSLFSEFKTRILLKAIAQLKKFFNPFPNSREETDAKSIIIIPIQPAQKSIKMPMRGRMPSRNSSVVDFDLTSTVMAPSETENQEYTSNVDAAELRKDFFAGYSQTTSLPIHSSRRYLINSINSYSTVIIEGATGTGKTTQVPMYILEDAIINKKQDRSPIVYVTQPRKIAARSIAQRICDEHGWQVGSIVGYQVGLDKVVGPQTVLVFCTAGVLLQKLITEKSLKNYTHIIIDEAHERDADTDLLMMMIRTLMRSETCFFRLIIMSATMDMSKLKNYFTFRTTYGHRALKTPSICKIDAEKRPSDIQLVYFDKLRATFGIDALPLPEFEYDQPDLAEESLKGAAKIILDVIPHLDTFCEATKSTLVFLPGLAEIHRMHRLLKHAEAFLEIIPLHSCISAQDQIKVFLPSKPGCRKVILATNIAESSITVKDVGFIVDFCLTKTLMKDEITRFPTLKLQWSTIDKCTQRAGRTGRCCPGKVFRMISLDFFKRNFQQYALPELLTGPLELSVLRIKNFQMGEVKVLMASVIDPPPVNEIRTAVLELKQIGALSSTYDGHLDDLDGDLTELGKVISALPIDVHLSKLIVLAASLDVLEDAIIVAACLSTNRSIVRHLYERELESYQNKLDWSRGSHSDLFVALDVYKEFAHIKRQKGKDLNWLGAFCARKNLDDRKLYEVTSMIEELTNRLEQQNIIICDQPNRQRDENEDELMLKVAFCAAFYPNYFLTSHLNAEEVDRELCGLDPGKTVILHNFPTNSTPLYRTQILDQFEKFTAHDKDYIVDTSRAYMVFNNDILVPEDMSSQVVLKTEGVINRMPAVSKSVHLALRYGLFNNIFVREFKENASLSRMLYYEEKRSKLERLMQEKLMPARIKLVVGRRADNSHLLDSDVTEYETIMAKDNFFEVEFNQRQDLDDRQSLHALERKEGKVAESQRLGHSFHSINEYPEGSDHPLFKPSYREIHGPTSPIRMSFRSVLSKSSGYTVEVDAQSVNSILLNTDYSKPRRQMLVAASVGQTKKNRVLARDTTLMPNIRGLPSIMALLFAQYYRMVYNENLKCFGGAVFGIGWDDDDQPINSNYEVELGFDVYISSDDIELINEARQKISRLIKFTEVANPGAPQAKMQQELRQIILALIGRRRFALGELNMVEVDYSEGRFVKDKHNVPESQTTRLTDGQTRPFLPVAKVTKNYNSNDLINSIRVNLEDLRKIRDAEAKPPVDGIHCLLCGSGLDDSFFFIMQRNIVQHLRSENHVQRLSEFEVFKQRTEIDESVLENGHSMARVTL